MVLLFTHAQTLHDKIDSLSFSLGSLVEIVRLDMWQPSPSIKKGRHVACIQKTKIR